MAPILINNMLVMKRVRYRGFSLPDLLFAMLILSVGLGGLMRYQQNLNYQLYRLNDIRQTWRIAEQLLDIYPQQLPQDFRHWRSSTQVIERLQHCEIIEATVMSPQHREATLKRLICSD
jgi:prepilin peptidase dependent protein C